MITQTDPTTQNNVWLLGAQGEHELKPMETGPMRDNGRPISPDGRWLAHFSDDTGRFQLYVESLPVPGRRVPVSQDGALAAWWTRDGRQLLFVGDDSRTLCQFCTTVIDPIPTLTLGTCLLP